MRLTPAFLDPALALRRKVLDLRRALLRTAPAALSPRPVDGLPQGSAADLVTARHDIVHHPDLPGPAARSGWMDGRGTPYVLSLRDAVFHPRNVLLQGPGAAVLPEPLAYGDAGLLVGADGALYPDSFGTSCKVTAALRPGHPHWQADLPTRIERLPGTWLFAELFCAHFGHVLFDTPARLWPLQAGLIGAERIDGIIGHGMMGAGLTGLRFPRYARDLLAAIGIAPGKIRFVTRPVQVERLLVPRRIAPYDAVWHPVFAQMMRAAGARLADQTETPPRIWLSRSRFASDSRGGPRLGALDTLAERMGFAVIHPQTLPFRSQIALARGATHIAGPVGSQLHLCAFAAKPGVQVLTVSPEYFKLPFNNMLVEDIGGRETHFTLPLPRPEGLAHRVPWRFDPQHLPDFEAEFAAWSGPR